MNNKEIIKQYYQGHVFEKRVTAYQEALGKETFSFETLENRLDSRIELQSSSMLDHARRISILATAFGSEKDRTTAFALLQNVYEYSSYRSDGDSRVGPK